MTIKKYKTLISCLTKLSKQMKMQCKHYNKNYKRTHKIRNLILQKFSRQLIKHKYVIIDITKRLRDQSQIQSINYILILRS